MRLGGEDWVDVGLVETVVLYALDEEADGRDRGDAQGRPSVARA